MELAPVRCDNKCSYDNMGCAELAGFQENQCCNQPLDPSAACTMEFAPVACSTANCIYDNPCIAGKFGRAFGSLLSGSRAHMPLSIHLQNLLVSIPTHA